MPTSTAPAQTVGAEIHRGVAECYRRNFESFVRKLHSETRKAIGERGVAPDKAEVAAAKDGIRFARKCLEGSWEIAGFRLTAVGLREAVIPAVEQATQFFKHRFRKRPHYPPSLVDDIVDELDDYRDSVLSDIRAEIAGLELAQCRGTQANTTSASLSPPAGATEKQIRLQEIQAFIERTSPALGRKTRKTDIWRVANHTDATQFERFQRCDPRTTPGDIVKFQKILSLTPEEFRRKLEAVSESE